MKKFKVVYDAKKVGERIRELRKEMGIGQIALAQDTGFSNAVISYWETGKNEPGARALLILAQYFNVSIDYILGLENA